MRAGAVSELLVTDELFKSNVLNERLKYTALVDAVKGGAKVHSFSTANVTGERTLPLEISLSIYRQFQSNAGCIMALVNFFIDVLYIRCLVIPIHCG